MDVAQLSLTVATKGLTETLAQLEKFEALAVKVDKAALKLATSQEQYAAKQAMAAIKQQEAEERLRKTKASADLAELRLMEKKVADSKKVADAQSSAAARAAAAEEKSYERAWKAYEKYQKQIERERAKAEQQNIAAESKRLDAIAKAASQRATGFKSLEKLGTQDSASISKQDARQKTLEQNQQYKQYKLDTAAAQASQKALQKEISATKSEIDKTEKAFQKHGNAAAKAAQDAKASVGSVKDTVLAIGAAAGIGFSVDALANFARGAVTLADEMTNLRARMDLVTKSSVSTQQVFGTLFTASQKSGTSFTANADSFVQLARATENLNLPTQKLTDLTIGFSNAAALSGTNAESFRSAMTQLNQGLASGVLRGQEFNSVAEQAPLILKAMADGLRGTNDTFDEFERSGLSGVAALRAMSKEGQLTNDITIPALLKGFESVNAEMEKLPRTVGRAAESFKNQLAVTVDQINTTTGGTKSLASAIDTITASIKDSTPAITTVVENLGNLSLVLGAGVLGKILSNTVTALGGVRAEMIASAEATATYAAKQVALKNSLVEKERMLSLATGSTMALRQAELAAASAAEQHAVAQAKLTAVTSGYGVAATSASLAARGFSTVVGALGGPVGIAITALSLLIIYWDDLKQSVLGATAAHDNFMKKAKQVNSTMKVVEIDVNIAATQAQIAALSAQLQQATSVATSGRVTARGDVRPATKEDIAQVGILKEQLRDANLILVQQQNIRKESSKRSREEADAAIDAATQTSNAAKRAATEFVSTEKKKLDEVAGLRRKFEAENKAAIAKGQPFSPAEQADRQRALDQQISSSMNRGVSRSRAGSVTPSLQQNLAKQQDSALDSAAATTEFLSRQLNILTEQGSKYELLNEYNKKVLEYENELGSIKERSNTKQTDANKLKDEERKKTLEALIPIEKTNAELQRKLDLQKAFNKELKDIFDAQTAFDDAFRKSSLLQAIEVDSVSRRANVAKDNLTDFLDTAAKMRQNAETYKSDPVKVQELNRNAIDAFQLRRDTRNRSPEQSFETAVMSTKGVLDQQRAEGLLSAQDYQDQLTEIERYAEDARNEYRRKSMETQLTDFQSLTGSVLDIMKSAGMEQSGLYKAMFAVEKAAAIARAIVNIQGAISSAAFSLPFPANLGAMATVAASTASIVSTISSTNLAFAKGGAFTGSIGSGAGDVVTVPTQFQLSGGRTGLMGEAGGPGEAIVPLSRDSQGRLGVSLNGGMTPTTSGDTNVQTNQINITVQGGNTNEETANTISRELLKTMERIADSRISNARRPNGILTK